MNREQLNSCFIQSISYYINSFDASHNYTTLEQMECTIDYDENGNTILSSWEGPLDEPTIEELMLEDYSTIIAYWRILMLPQQLTEISQITTAEGIKLTTLSGIPQGAFVIINGVLNIWLSTSFVSLS